MTDTQKDSFWARVDPHKDGCHFWIGRRMTSGYGQFVYFDRVLKKPTYFAAHRVAYELVVGPIEPVELTIDHLCGNKLCVNTEHLRPLSHLENARQGPVVARKLMKAKKARRAQLEQEVVELRAEVERLRSLLGFAPESAPESDTDDMCGVGFAGFANCRRSRGHEGPHSVVSRSVTTESAPKFGSGEEAGGG